MTHPIFLVSLLNRKSSQLSYKWPRIWAPDQVHAANLLGLSDNDVIRADQKGHFGTDWVILEVKIQGVDMAV